MVSVVAGRQRPPRQHRKLGAEHFVAELLHSTDFALDLRVALNQRDIAERVRGALRHITIEQLDFALERLTLGDNHRDQDREQAAQNDKQQSITPVNKERRRQQYDQ